MLRVATEQIGEVIVSPKHKLSDEKKFAIKSLQFIIMICMDPEENEESNKKFKNLLSVVSDSIHKIEKIFTDKPLEEIDCGATELFIN